MDYCYHMELTDARKPSQGKPEVRSKLLKKDVDHGFSLVIAKEQVPVIPSSMV
jgi:hypothetical protein